MPQEDLYAATPPAGAQNLLLSMLCTRLSRRRKRYELCFLDVRRAFFHAQATEEVFVELPEEDREAGKDLVGLLLKSMYGTRSASRNWQKQLGEDLKKLGYLQALSSPCLYCHVEEDARLVILGDDFWLLADQDGLDALKPELHRVYTLKENGTLGPDATDDKAVSSLNQQIRYLDRRGVEVEADPRNVELLVRAGGVVGLLRPGRAHRVRRQEAQLGDDELGVSWVGFDLYAAAVDVADLPVEARNHFVVGGVPAQNAVLLQGVHPVAFGLQGIEAVLVCVPPEVVSRASSSTR